MNVTILRIAPRIKRIATSSIDRIYLELQLRRSTPVCVYQMGKGGSTSIHVSLSKHYDGAVLRAHNFVKYHEDPHIRLLYSRTVLHSHPVNIISFTRDPISRNVSAFFQNFEKFMGVSFDNSHFFIEDIKTAFISKFQHRRPLVWFDRNILLNFGIDVFATPFSESGVSIYHNNNVRLLVIRSELPDDHKVEAIVEFLGHDDLRLQSINLGTEKNYSKIYRAFKNEVLFPSDYVEWMCESKYFNHVYNRKKSKLHEGDGQNINVTLRFEAMPIENSRVGTLC